MVEIKNIVKFNAEQFKEIGKDTMDAIRAEASKGIMQNDTSGHSYRNKVYISKKRRGKFKRQISTNVAFVDMTLTGDLWNRRKLLADDNGFVIMYDNADKGKVERAFDMGRDITTISNHNADIIVSQLEDIVEENIDNLSKIIDEIKLGITI